MSEQTVYQRRYQLAPWIRGHSWHKRIVLRIIIIATTLMMAHLILFFLIHWSSHAFFLCSIVVSLFLLLSCIVYSSSSRWQNKPQCQLNRLLKTLTCSVMFSFVIWKTVAQMKNNAELLFVDNVETMANVLHEPFQFPSLSTNRSFAFFSFEPQFSILNERKHH